MADWIIETITSVGYLGIFLLMLLESIFPPIPSELIIPFGGFAAQRGDLDFFLVILVATAGAVIGMLPWYFAGRLLGLARVKWLSDRFGRWFALNSDEIDMATAWFRRYGPAIVFFGRMLPLIRTLISIPAGLAQMRLSIFLVASGAGALIFNTVLVSAGFLMAEHYHLVEAVLDPLTTAVLILVVVVYVWRVIVWKPGVAK